jgi:hypothetical protein
VKRRAKKDEPRSIRLTPKDGRQMWAKVDAADYDLVMRFAAWHVTWDNTTVYACTTKSVGGDRIYLFMQQLIMGPGPAGTRITHLNGRGLDNRRANLRHATQNEILAKRKPPKGGSSRHKGVCWDPERGLWLAAFNRRKLDRYKDEDDAAKAFDDAAFAKWGHLAFLNFPERYEGVEPGGEPHEGRIPVRRPGRGRYIRAGSTADEFNVS